jgi:V8-like Glu-specific endopeptidase
MPFIRIKEKESIVMHDELNTTSWRLGARTIQKIRRRPGVALTGVAATAMLSVSLAGAPFAQASVASGTPAAIGHQVNANGSAKASAAHIRAFWTRDRLLSARNADVLHAKPGAAVQPGAHSAKPQTSGPPARVAGALPAKQLAAGHRSAPVARRAAGSFGSPWYLPSYLPPATTSGKVFFTTTGGGYTQYWQCSASTVNSGGKDIVITAGHCVYGSLGGEVPGEGWHGNWMFIPDYSNGNAPYGTWTARQLWTLSNYYNTGGSMADEGDDIGAAVMNTNSYGQHIVNVVGGQGIEWNYPYYQYVYDFGYPAQSPFNGQVLDYCNGGEFNWGWVVPNTMGLNCNFNGGSSGGPWLSSFNGEWGYINGVNDFGYSSLPNYIFAGYFGSNAGNLYNAVAGL